MVLPIYKVLSLVIRVFSKPLVSYIKQAHLKNDASASYPFLRKGFIWLGNAYNKGETWVNRKFMKIDSQFAYKPLNDELAIEKGIQFFYQIFFYSLVIGLPLYQMMRASNQAKAKSKALDEKLKKIDNQLEQLLKIQKNHNQQPKQAIKIEEEQILKTETVVVQKIQQKIPEKMEKEDRLHTIKLNFPDQKTHIYHIFFTKSFPNTFSTNTIPRGA